MEAKWDFPSPLAINVDNQVLYLLQLVPQDSPLAQVLKHTHTGAALLAQLSLFLRRPAYTLPITKAFRPLLVDLCVRWLDDKDDLYQKLEALALLIETHEELYPVFYRFLRAHFLRGPLNELYSSSDEIDNRILQSVLLSYYRVLHAIPSLPRELDWDLSHLHGLLSPPHSDRGVLWLAIRCSALQAETCEARREEVEDKILGKCGEEDCNIYYGEDVHGNPLAADGWVIPVIETNRVQQYRNKLVCDDDYYSTDAVSVITLHSPDLSPRTADVHGILLVKDPIPEPPSSSLVNTSSSVKALRQIAVNISLRCPTLLTSAPSSGKTSLISHLATLLFPSVKNQVVTIHLADTSLDPRSLLGSYVSSPSRPGEFEWRDGVLVKAMREGKWLLLKDIDRASNEVLGLLGPIAESLDDSRPIGSKATLQIPNRGEVHAAESFHIFATRSIENGTPPLFLGSNKWHEIVIQENSAEDLRSVLESKFPNVAGPIAYALIGIWLIIRALPPVASARTFGIRDLEKFCNRVSSLLLKINLPPKKDGDGHMTKPLSELLPNPSLREEIFLEARDIFFSTGTTTKAVAERRDTLSRLVGEKLGLSEETQEWVLKCRVPNFEIEKDVDGRPVAVHAGRTALHVNPQKTMKSDHPVRGFTMHKQAVRLISQLATCVASVEPVLLTGETGTGKTSIVSHLAFLLNKPLISVNLSNQSEASDLVGGFRPVSARMPAMELHERFLTLFMGTFSGKKNIAFRQSIDKAVVDSKWKAAVKLWAEASKLALNKLREELEVPDQPQGDHTSDNLDSQTPRKRRKLDSATISTSVSKWTAFQSDVRQFETQYVRSKGKSAFQFVEGPLVKAVRTGAWILLDEINLASPETLECIAGLLQGPKASIILSEQGSLEPIPRHPEFRLFGCMNPATDVGKRDLPANIRTKFTELGVPSADEDQEALLSLINHYIGHLATSDKTAVYDVAQFYTNAKALSEAGKLADMANKKPHYSMRTLSRALTFAADTIHNFGLRRALFEGFTMAFTMVLDQTSANLLFDVARRTILSSIKNVPHFLSQQPVPPRGPSENVLIQIGHFWLPVGTNDLDEMADYILTPSVQKKLTDLSRIIMTKRYPILIEGPTSSGKTSAINYLARRTGHTFVRINNHEHTDIQEYLGSYVSDPQSGKLVFRDGLLVTALRQGHWVVLDELNLAPTDVLEALNRLLDDNRELLIPETNEVVRPHPNFVLFATQNPSGVYGGRKVLSRALRNRFLEVHFDDMPPSELEHILCQRSRIPPSYSRRIVFVFEELRKRRQIGRIFEGKQGFATLRDLFRWAGREANSYEELAGNGYMLLAERARQPDDKQVVKEVIEKAMNVTISEDILYYSGTEDPPILDQDPIVWTKSMRRLFILLSRALQYNEPVLLVGETGSGKTSVCQVFAELRRKKLRTVNCHQNTEASDIIGGLRPVRHSLSGVEEAASTAVLILQGHGTVVNTKDREGLLSCISTHLAQDLTEEHRAVLLQAQHVLTTSSSILGWQDGPLVTSMRGGDVFLLDEISLADDSVLERLNSVLEPSRTLVLAEKGGEKIEDFDIVASEGFKFVATMNPGGDFGKKELSPALRNRFTEIWVPSIMHRSDLEQIVAKSWKYEDLLVLTTPLLDFVDWIGRELKDDTILTPRDILSWVSFCNTMHNMLELTPATLFVHGGQMSIVDGLPSLSQLSSWSQPALLALRLRAIDYLEQRISSPSLAELISSCEIRLSGESFGMGPFSISFGPMPVSHNDFNFVAPTTKENTFRLLRACQVNKPILLEGSPGVGKTSLVTALAAASGQKLYRINLSEQTDLVDLFGSDLPVNGSATGQFAWSDADFLKALKEGHWVLLDEMNLASQSVLEGLNAVFDHRGTVFIPELDRTFVRHPRFRIFTAQNPLNQGSGRKGLPKSFLNRFTKVYIDQLSSADLFHICNHLFPSVPTATLQRMINFNSSLHEEVVVKKSFGKEGQPWEFNLRDILRWASLLYRHHTFDQPWMHLNTVYGSRFRQPEDRQALCSLFDRIFSTDNVAMVLQPRTIITPRLVSSGACTITRGKHTARESGARFLRTWHNEFEAALTCVAENWLIIITGPEKSGKTSFVRSLASLAGHALREIPLSSSSDTSDLIGSFEQLDIDFQLDVLHRMVARYITAVEAQLSFGDSSSFKWLCKIKDNLSNAMQSGSLKGLTDVAYAVMDVTKELDLREERIFLADYLTVMLQQEGQGPSFGWVDGPLVEAMRHGDWLLLDNANLSSPTVLDRLNSLCELNGSLILTEKGMDQSPIIPHPGFRLIMTVNPRHGEISRAMRNRGVEISLNPTGALDVEDGIIYSRRMPLIPSPINGLHDPARQLFDLYRRGLLLPVRHRRNWKPVLRSSNIVHEDHLACHLLQFLDVVSQFSELPEDLLAMFSAEVTLTKYLPYFCRAVNVPNLWYDCREFSKESLFQALNVLRVTKEVKSLEVTTVSREYQVFSGFLQNPFVNFIPEEVAEHHVRQRDVLESLVLATILERNAQSLTVTASSGDLIGHVSRKDMTNESVHKLLTELPKVLLDSAEISLSGTAFRISASVVLELTHFTRFMLNSASSGTLDISALVVVFDWMTNRLRKDTAGTLRPLTQLMESVQGQFVLSSGLGLCDMWKNFFCHRAAESPIVEHLLKVIALPAEEHGVKHRLMRRIIELSSLERAYGDIKCPDMDLLIPAIEEDPGQTDQVAAPVSPGRFNAPNLILELNYLADLYPSAPGKLNVPPVSKLIVQYSDALASNLDRLTAYQCLDWKIDSGEDSTSAINRAFVEWMKSLWDEDLCPDNIGPSLVFVPVFLRSTLRIQETVVEGTLRQLRSHTDQLDNEIERSLQECLQSKSRFKAIAGLTLNIVALFCSCFFSSFSEEGKRIFTELRGDRSDHKTVWMLLGELPNHSSSKPFSVAMKSLMEQLSGMDLQCLGQDTLSSESFQSLGFVWVSISQIILSSYVPNLDLDPCKAFRCEEEFKDVQSTWLHGQVGIHSFLESLRTGKGSNSLIYLLTSRLPHMAPKSSKATIQPPTMHIRDQSALSSFWREVRSFASDIIGSGRIQKLFAALACDSSESQSLEHILQDSVSNFLRRIKINYGMFSDLIPAIELSLFSLRFGLRIAVHSTQFSRKASETVLIEKIIGFNVPIARRILRGVDTAQIVGGAFTAGDALLLKLLGLLRDRVGLVPQSIFDINDIYRKFMILWERDEKDEVDRIRRSESLYRSKTDYEPDVSTEENELKKLFPTYSEDDDTMNGGQLKPDTHHRGSLITQELSRQLYAAHMGAFGCRPNASACTSLWYSLQHRLLSSMVNEHFEALPLQLDRESLAFRLRLLHGIKHDALDDSIEHYNFYRDPNHSEARKAYKTVMDLRSNLSKLIKEWPEQMVLQHLRDRCDMVLSLRSCSPLAMFLGALERLLLQTDDWELYANRDNTLKDHRQRIGDLILAWRHLELKSWKNLLDSESTTFCSELFRWWFNLYNIIIRGTLCLDTTQKVEVNTYISSLTLLVEEFLTSAPLGQYEERLSLVKTFATFTRELSGATYGFSDSSINALRRVQTVLTSICHYYEQFCPTIRSSLSDRRLAIENEIRGLMQVSTWRDTNVHALQQNAQRMHKQLYRRIRKFRDLLREPVINHLQFFDSATLDNLYTVLTPSSRSFVNDSRIPTEVIAKLRKFTAVFDQNSGLLRNSSLSIEELSVKIINGTDELSKATPPSSIGSDQQRRWYASLLTQKKRMWNDTLKELKEIGLTPHLKPEIVEQHRKRASLMEQPSMPSSCHAMQETADKIDSYLYRSIGVFTMLLNSCAEHHSDILTRELQRGISSIEHGLSIAIHARSVLIERMVDASKLRTYSDRLQSVAESTSSISHPSAYDALLKARCMANDIVDNTDELLSLCKVIIDIQDDNNPMDTRILEDVLAWKSRSEVVLEKITKIVRNVETTSFALVLQEEEKSLSSITSHLDDTKTFLDDLAYREPKIAQFCQAAALSIYPISVDYICHSRREETYDSQEILDVLLVSAQTMATIQSETPMESGFEEADHVRRHVDIASRIGKALKMPLLLELTGKFILKMRECEKAAPNIWRFLPFLHRYLDFVDDFLTRFAVWIKALFKLVFIGGSILRRIANEGFCRPPAQSEESGKSEGDLEASDGVGLGEGSGNENVSNQIEDESQYEGMQDQKTEDDIQQQQKQEAGDDLEVDFDLNGDLEDGPDKEGDDDDEQESLGDLDEEFGQDIDEPEESNNVDEEFWNDDRKETDGEDTDKPASKTGDNTEVVGKDEQRIEGDDQGDVAKDPGSIDDTNADAEEESSKGQDVEQEYHDALDPVMEDEKIDQGESEETPDDMHDAGGLSDMEDDEVDNELPEEGEEMVNERQNVDVEIEDIIKEEEQKADAGNQTNPSDVRADTQSGAFDDPADSGSGPSSAIPQEVDGAIENTPTNEAQDIAEAKASGPQQKQANKSESLEAQSQANEADAQTGTSMRSSLGIEKPIPNPYRSPGDALKEVRRRINEIFSSQAEQTVPRDVGDDTQVEYAQQDDMDVDMQALGPAAENEHAKLKDLNLIEEDAADNTPLTVPELKTVSQETDIAEMLDNGAGKKDNDCSEVDKETAGLKSRKDTEVNKDLQTAELPSPQDEIQEQQLQKHAEEVLSRWRRDGQPIEEAQYVWQLYESLTQSLSFTLCEQLRLILEPTKATRLMGDFRTGKRLNMKKIIPYIASNYTKDKIWLRRVRPSQREYQILIALDDSRSMAESHSVHLAFQTLALVTKALTRLEAGDVAVASFGEAMTTLHSFDEGPFTDQAGTRVVEAFKFQQNATDVRKLLESSVDFLMKAREGRLSSSSSDLWQLEIIISDGICHDHEDLRSILRRAEEERILVVFVIIDAPKSNANDAQAARPVQDSIFDMKQATYRTVNGKMELHMQQYLDTFPFEYFVILKDVEALPDVLSDTLRQFFERLSTE